MISYKEKVDLRTFFKEMDLYPITKDEALQNISLTKSGRAKY